MKVLTYAVGVILAAIFGLALTACSQSDEMTKSDSMKDEITKQRATQAAIWGMPAVSMRGIAKSTQRDLSGDWNDVVYFSTPMTSRHGVPRQDFSDRLV